VALMVTILGSYFLQTRVADEEGLILHFGFAPIMLDRGQYGSLLTALFLHGGWAHAAMNAVGALAFGAPVARLLARRPQRDENGVGIDWTRADDGSGQPMLGGAAIFFLFYLVCGALGSLGYGLVHHGSGNILVGASGAVSGLMGASSRMMERRGALSSLASRTVVGMAAAWIVANLLIGLTGLAPGTGGAPVAWEAHLFGYAAGLLLIGPLARVLRRV
jgi:membrane associated rhomboid family serine protease